MIDFKVGDLVEIIKNDTHTMDEKFDLYKPGDKAIVTEVYKSTVRIGQGTVNMIPKYRIKKVETKPELTENEKELALLLAEKIKEKDNLIKEIKEITKKLLTK